MKRSSQTAFRVEKDCPRSLKEQRMGESTSNKIKRGKERQTANEKWGKERDKRSMWVREQECEWEKEKKEWITERKRENVWKSRFVSSCFSFSYTPTPLIQNSFFLSPDSTNRTIALWADRSIHSVFDSAKTIFSSLLNTDQLSSGACFPCIARLSNDAGKKLIRTLLEDWTVRGWWKTPFEMLNYTPSQEMTYFDLDTGTWILIGVQ